MQFKKYISMVLLLLMVVSSFAFVGFQGLPAPTGDFSALTPEQEKKLINAGRTIVIFSRPADCQECQETSAFLHQISISYADQITLVEKDAEATSILIKSAYGQKILGLATNQRISAVLCEMMVNPPPSCINGEL